MSLGAICRYISKLIPRLLYIHLRLIHVTDWLPTLLSAAGHNAGQPTLDGLDQWESLSKGGPSPRKEMLYNVQMPAPPAEKARYGAALRVGEMKLVRGDAGRPDGWYPPQQVLGLDDDEVGGALMDNMLDQSWKKSFAKKVLLAFSLALIV